MKKNILVILILLFTISNVSSQNANNTNTDKTKLFENKPALQNIFNRIAIKSYGVVNYYNFEWQTDSSKRDAVDLERLNLYLKFKISEKIEVKSEMEFEHGGTGTTMEFDRFEEFGEFETEIEAGGEVLLEQLYIQFAIKPWLKIRAGKMEMDFGNTSKFHVPTEYFTGYRSSMEVALFPDGWSEIGIQVLGNFGKNKNWAYRAYFVNSLASSGFSSANWIARGYQRRFEMANAESFAGLLRLDYKFKNKGWLGFSTYVGETNRNRPKPDMKGIDGYVFMGDLHTSINIKKFLRIRAMFFYGHLQNSHLISRANRNLSNRLNVKRTPVGSDALGYYGEIGVDVLSFTKLNKMNLWIFGRYDFYDSMYKTHEDIFKFPRAKRSQITFGLNYLPHPSIIIKAHYAHRTIGFTSGNIEQTYLLGIGYIFKTKNYYQ